MSEKKRTARQLILLGLVVACAVVFTTGMFLPWLTWPGKNVNTGQIVPLGVPLFESDYTIMSNIANTFPINAVRFCALLCALACGGNAFLIIFGVVDMYQPEKGIKYFWSIATIVVGLALAGLSITYLLVFNANTTTVLTLNYGFIAIPFGTICSGICLLLYR